MATAVAKSPSAVEPMASAVAMYGARLTAIEMGSWLVRETATATARETRAAAEVSAEASGAGSGSGLCAAAVAARAARVAASPGSASAARWAAVLLAQAIR